MLTLIVFTTTEMQDLTGIQQRSETTQRMRIPGRPHQHVFVNDATPTNVPSSNHPPQNVHPWSPDKASSPTDDPQLSINCPKPQILSRMFTEGNVLAPSRRVNYGANRPHDRVRLTERDVVTRLLGNDLAPPL